jgi:hypothetical protein
MLGRQGACCYWVDNENGSNHSFLQTMSELKMELQAALVDLGHKSAFDLLLKEAWNPEQAAMGNFKNKIQLIKMSLLSIKTSYK